MTKADLPLEPLIYIHQACGARVAIVREEEGSWERAKQLMKEHKKSCRSA